MTADFWSGGLSQELAINIVLKQFSGRIPEAEQPFESMSVNEMGWEVGHNLIYFACKNLNVCLHSKLSILSAEAMPDSS